MATALTQIPQHYVTEFGTNWEHLVQQKQSRLKSLVTFEKVTGKEKKINQMGTLSMARVTTRAGQTRTSDTPLDARWLRPAPYDLASIFDEWDEEFLGQVVLPTSDTVKAHGAAYERACDDIIIAAIEGTAYSGENGTTPETLGSGQQVAVNFMPPATTGSNSGLTLAKLIRAKHILGVNELDDSEDLIFVHSQQQLSDLLNNVNEVKSTDYAQVKALVEGTINRFMGFTFIRSERLTLNSSTDVRTCLAYAKSGIRFSDTGRTTHMDVRADLSHALQIRSVVSLGAVRMEEEKVVAVFCDQSP